VQVLPVPGTSSFLLLVNNTGNTEDAYTATVTRATPCWSPPSRRAGRHSSLNCPRSPPVPRRSSGRRRVQRRRAEHRCPWRFRSSSAGPTSN
jgi:hypothetical protein